MLRLLQTQVQTWSVGYLSLDSTF